MNPSKSLQKAIERARKTMVPRVFKQEYEASFVQFPGQVFYELSPEENRVAEAPLAFQRVILGIDFGDVNPGICVVGLAGGIWYFLEAWQPRGGNPVPQPIFDQELLRIATRWRPDGCFCDPSRPSAILGIRSLGREHGQPGLIKAVAGYNPIAEGCGQVHSLIYQRRLLWPMGTPGYQGPPQAALDGYMSPSMAFDLITSYHKASDSFGTVLDRIADGQDDHASVDALRYALATKSG
jgi:hypothetical protein